MAGWAQQVPLDVLEPDQDCGLKADQAIKQSCFIFAMVADVNGNVASQDLSHWIEMIIAFIINTSVFAIKNLEEFEPANTTAYHSWSYPVWIPDRARPDQNTSQPTAARNKQPEPALVSHWIVSSSLRTSPFILVVETLEPLSPTSCSSWRPSFADSKHGRPTAPMAWRASDVFSESRAKSTTNLPTT